MMENDSCEDKVNNKDRSGDEQPAEIGDSFRPAELGARPSVLLLDAQQRVSDALREKGFQVLTGKSGFGLVAPTGRSIDESRSACPIPPVRPQPFS